MLKATRTHPLPEFGNDFVFPKDVLVDLLAHSAILQFSCAEKEQLCGFLLLPTQLRNATALLRSGCEKYHLSFWPEECKKKAKPKKAGLHAGIP